MRIIISLFSFAVFLAGCPQANPTEELIEQDPIHVEKTRIIDKEEVSVKYSVFPYFVSKEIASAPEFDDFEKILRYEFQIAKKSRFELLQKQNRKAIEFNTNISEGIESYACIVRSLPIYRQSKVFLTDVIETGFYKLYVHDNHKKKTYRYSFREESLKGGKKNLVLLSWDNKNWDMQELYDENMITLSVPSNISNDIEISLNDDNTKSLSFYKKGKSINPKIEIEQSYAKVNDQDKWGTLDREDRIVFGDNPDKNIEKIEIIVSEDVQSLNIRIKDKQDSNSKWNKLFLGVLSISLIALLY